MKKVPVRKLVFGILGVVLGLIIGFMAPPAELTVESMHYLGLLVWFICWMIGGVMPDFMTGVTFLVLAVLLKLCDFTTAFSPFAGTTTWLLVGAFGVGAMLNKTGVLRRIAYVIMQLFPGTYTGQMLALYAAGIIVSPMMPSITAKAALMSPLSIPAAEAFGFEKNSKGATGLFMASYWSSGILGNFFFTGCVYVGTMMAYLDEQTIAMLNFWSWLKYFWPYLLVFAVGGFFILRILFQPKEYQPLPAGFVKAKLKELGPMSRDEKLSLIILVVMVAGWLTADLTGISVTLWSVIGLILMSAFGIFKPADFGARIPWTIITLIASISTLATLMGTYGIPDWLTAVLSPVLGPVASNQVLLIIAIGVVVFALRWGVASMFTSGALIYALFAGLGNALGMNTLVVVFIGYMGVQCWPFGAYNATLMAGLGSVNGLVEFNKIQKLTFVYSALVIVAALINLPIWKLTGLC